MKNKLLIITGDKGSGKTTRLEEIAFYLRMNGYRVGGFIAKGFWKQNERSHFLLHCPDTAAEKLYCTRERKENWSKVKHFYINPDAIIWGKGLLSEKGIQDKDIIVIDEVGPFELEKNGWYNAIENLLSINALPMIWVVRAHLINEVTDFFGVKPDLIINVEDIEFKKIKEKEICNLLFG